MSNPNTRKSCVVPKCKNTTTNSPDNFFFIVPKDVKMRKKWIKAMKRLDPFGDNSTVYCCEDHFNLESDMENYIRYKIMGSVKRIKMNPNCVPTRFSCQTEGKRKHLVTKVEGVVKKRVHSIEKSTLSNSSDASGDPVVSASTSNQPVQSNEKQLITRETRTEHNETYENLADNRQIMVKIEDEEILEKIQNSINYETKTVPQHVEDKVKTDRPRRTQVRKNVLEVTNVVCGSKRKKEVTLKRKVICSPKVYQNALATKVDTIIARVYHFFKKEYDFLAKKYGKLLDLTPFSKHKERTAQATGFHINVVEKAVAEVVKKPGKKPKKKKRKKNIKKIEVEDNR
ncbi:uncharacterized protein LOC113506818 isoform X4 [Trichoplusia ni]|uniref:Uncharacterized protein LOC113506818 isoform X4 n=1 Tax=Trichoplusia ni TaxID=7111 RepID=A0A7E5WYX6_TRINI|nr:uncharacterized protein LOC113506818 isoform X4 [Trichoplusia ni]